MTSDDELSTYQKAQYTADARWPKGVGYVTTLVEANGAGGAANPNQVAIKQNNFIIAYLEQIDKQNQRILDLQQEILEQQKELVHLVKPLDLSVKASVAGLTERISKLPVDRQQPIKKSHIFAVWTDPVKKVEEAKSQIDYWKNYGKGKNPASSSK